MPDKENVFKFKGKIAVWFWAIVIVVNTMLLYELIFSRDSMLALVLGGAIFNLVFLPIILRNYVLLNNDSVIVYFGFGKASIKVSNIEEVYQTHNPLASSAASLDRIVIKGNGSEIMCSVKEKTKLFEELKKLNPGIVIR